MTLGSRIQSLRKEHNLSQGDLADALNISRQSVSKWETDTATPDLDKLLKLSELFGVTLDELVKGSSPNHSEQQTISASAKVQPVPVTIKTGLETRQIAAIILLCMTFLVILVCSILGGFLAGLIYSIPFLVCGLICIFVRIHTGVYCGWSIVIMLEFLTRLGMSVHWQLVFQPWLYTNSYPLHIALCWAHFAIVLLVIGVTFYSFRIITPKFDTNLKHILFCCFAVYLILHLPISKFLLSSIVIKEFIHSNWWLIALLNIVQTLGRQIIFTILVVYVLAWHRQRKII